MAERLVAPALLRRLVSATCPAKLWRSWKQCKDGSKAATDPRRPRLSLDCIPMTYTACFSGGLAFRFLMLRKLLESLLIMVGGIKNKIVINLIPSNSAHRTLAPVSVGDAVRNNASDKPPAALQLEAWMIHRKCVVFTNNTQRNKLVGEIWKHWFFHSVMSRGLTSRAQAQPPSGTSR